MIPYPLNDLPRLLEDKKPCEWQQWELDALAEPDDERDLDEYNEDDEECDYE